MKAHHSISTIDKSFSACVSCTDFAPGYGEGVEKAFSKDSIRPGFHQIRTQISRPAVGMSNH